MFKNFLGKIWSIDIGFGYCVLFFIIEILKNVWLSLQKCITLQKYKL